MKILRYLPHPGMFAGESFTDVEDCLDVVVEDVEMWEGDGLLTWLTPFLPGTSFAGAVLAIALVTLLGGCAVTEESARDWCQKQGLGTSAQVEECVVAWTEETTAGDVILGAAAAAAGAIAPAEDRCYETVYWFQGERRYTAICP